MTRVLSIHEAYRCHQRGACCNSGWPIPVEVDLVGGLRSALESGRLRTVRGSAADAIVAVDDAPAESPARLGMSGKRCVFYGSPSVDDCAIHHALGHNAMPLACRQFPRVSVHDPRGTSVTLSHFCPTVSAMLQWWEGPVTIVENPDAFPAGGEYVGLDAKTQLPPLLRPGMLMDWESWWLWESLSVDVLANRDDAPEVAVARLRAAVEELNSWTPAQGPLADAMQAAIDRTYESTPAVRTPEELYAIRARVMECIPDELAGGTGSTTSNPPAPAIVSRFLAAHAFANWAIHLGPGLRAWLASVEAALALVLTGDDLGQADLKLRHLASPERLATRLT